MMMKRVTIMVLGILCIATAIAEETVGVWTGSQSLKPWASSENPEQYLAVSYEYKSYLEDAFMQDIVVISYEMTESQDNYSIKFSDPAGWDDLTGTSQNLNYASGTRTYSYTINNVVNLDIIRNRGIIIRGANVTVKQVQLRKVDTRYDAMPVIIGSTGYATWSCDKKLDFTGTGVTPYYASTVSTGTVTMSPISETGKENTTWDYQGYIVVGAPDTTYEVPVATNNENVYYPSPNYLVGTSNGEAKVFKSAFSDYSFTKDDYWYANAADSVSRATRIKTMYRYIFANGNSGVGFYVMATNYSREVDETTVYYHVLGARKAYLETDDDITPDPVSETPETPSPGVRLVFAEENNATAMEYVENSETATKFFRDGQLFIQKNGVTYDVTGRIIK